MAKMEDMFAEEAAAPKGGESAMKAAEELDMEEEAALTAATPAVNVKAGTLKALVGALNKVMPMFEAPPLEVEARDLKDEPLPTDVMKALQMINAAYGEYAGEDAVDVMQMEADKGALIEIAKLGKVFADKGFVKFLKSSETRATEAKEEVAEGPEEGEGDDEEEKMMMRMGMA